MGLKAEISHLPHKRKSDHLQHSLHSLSLSLSLSLPAPTASRLPFKSNSDFHFPMSLALVMNHGLHLGFQVGTRLHISKSKSNFPCHSLLSSDSKPSSLSLINGSLSSVLYFLYSLLISKPLLFILKQILLFLYIKTSC